MKKVVKKAFQKGLVNKNRGKFHSKFKIGDKVMFMGNTVEIRGVRFVKSGIFYDINITSDLIPAYSIDQKLIKGIKK